MQNTVFIHKEKWFIKTKGKGKKVSLKPDQIHSWGNLISNWTRMWFKIYRESSWELLGLSPNDIFHLLAGYSAPSSLVCPWTERAGQMNSWC